MKSGAIVLLLGLLAVWAQLPPAAAQVRPGACPNIRGPGICVERCRGDDSCPPGRKCCSNGCGHVCITPITRPRGRPGEAEVLQQRMWPRLHDSNVRACVPSLGL
ncbi:unnamed protein product [Caretta caretta]